MSRYLIALLLVIGPSLVTAHDFWIQPDEFWIQPQVSTPITVQVGHGSLRQRSPIPMSRIKRFEAFAPDGEKLDLRGSLDLVGSTGDGRVQLPGPGTYVLVLQTDNRAQSHLSAAKFNDYLQTEGLTTALEQRRRAHRMEMDGSERYSRVAISIVQVGGTTAPSQTDVSRVLGLPLQIVLERNPYAQPQAATLPARVIYEGRPLAGALIKLTDLEHDATAFETHVTGVDGRVTFAMPHSGKWLLNVIWTKPLSQSRETDFETVFSSLSFGVP